ncbi:GD14056 [Drosophila simulans]|uniref:GD14056 n=1 Tax=Drosophila simulans TaxID=7240 RepID=B4QLI6_DROSI|nr:GD14056 [Drosophila simulans]
MANKYNLCKKRNLDLSEESTSGSHAKRQCTENLFWPEGEDDDSFFSNAHLEDLLDGGGKDELFGTQANTSTKKMTQSGSDDELGLFADTSFQSAQTVLPNSASKPDETSAPTDNHQIDLADEENANELFKKINLYDLSIAEMEDIFHGADDFSEPMVQNTQLFLDAMTFKKPKTPEKLLADPKDDSMSFISKSVIEGLVQGTQYVTCEELKNQSLLDPVNWETQAFADFEKNNQVIDKFPSKGEFYGLPDKVKKMILEHKGIKSLYEWQNECLNLPAIRQRKNLIYALPTSGGKTLVAEILMLRELLCCERNVLFILPYVSIVQEKVSAMSPFAIDLDFIVEEYTAGKGKCPPQPRRKRRSLFIASIEKGAVLMDSLIDVQRPHEIGLVVVDELHLIGEKGRGATLEAFLTKVMFLNANIQIVGMSATIGNLSEISSFLNADVYTRGFRPVELKEYIKCGPDLLEINSAGQTLEEIFVPSRSVEYNYSEAVKRADPDHLAGLISECAPEHCCLVFCPSRKNCENVALLLSRIVPKHKFFEHRRSEKLDLMDALDKMCGILSPVLAKTLPYGIAYHHSGLTTDERKYIETAYRFGVVTVICCTSTLAAGVNLPAKRSKDNLLVGQMLFSPMDKALSSLDQNEAVGLQSLILSVVGLNLAECRRDLNRLVNSTLLSVQAKSLEVAVDEIVLRILREMFKNKVLQLAEPQAKSKINSSDIITSQDVSQANRPAGDRRLLIGQSTTFKLTNIGRAAFKAGIDYKRANAIHKELKQAQQQLILTNYLHLLYLVVCFNTNERGDELFPADASILFGVYTSLPLDSQAMFKQLGFTEAHAARLFKTQSVQGPLSLQLNRMYKVLILADILNLLPIPSVASKYNVERGTLQHLISQSTAAASAIVRLCEELEEFWCYKPLFERILHKMDRCGTFELEPLMELPAVKINRARQLYAAGFQTIGDIARVRPSQLVQCLEHMPLRVATEIVSAAKIILMKKLDHLEEETENLKDCLKTSDKN